MSVKFLTKFIVIKYMKKSEGLNNIEYLRYSIFTENIKIVGLKTSLKLFGVQLR